jgi:hypothetical protein
MRKNFVWSGAFLIFTIALFACGSGSSDPVAADTMTVTVSGPSGSMTKTYTKGTNSTLGHPDPDLYFYVTASISPRTGIELHTTQGDMFLVMSITGNVASVGSNTPQSYPTGFTTPGNTITYSGYDTNHIEYSSLFSSTSGTITISSIGNAGDKIAGTFDAVVTDTTNTLRVSGTFSVTRL